MNNDKHVNSCGNARNNRENITQVQKYRIPDKLIKDLFVAPI